MNVKADVPNPAKTPESAPALPQGSRSVVVSKATPVGGQPLAKADVLLALADRCEREEASREFDIEIYRSLYPAEPTPSLAGDHYPPPGFGTDALSLQIEAPFYTTSLDAAVTLPSKDWWRETNGPRRYLNIPSPSPNYWRTLITAWDLRSPKDFLGWSATEPLSICAAALRALAQQEEEERT